MSSRQSTYVKTDQKFGRWTALENALKHNQYILCRCDCGTERKLLAKNIMAGASKSCGCSRRDSLWRQEQEKNREIMPYVAQHERFGMLVTLEKGIKCNSLVKCRCDCGTEKPVKAANLRNNHSKSCGCMTKINSAIGLSKAVTTHGMSYHCLYPMWNGIVARTTNPKDDTYTWYGARGITMYEPWRTDPKAFITWIEENLGPKPEKHSLDRINNDGNYEPGNLRWATQKQQRHNQRSIVALTIERDYLQSKLRTLEKISTELSIMCA